MVHIYGVIISLAILASYLTAYFRRQKYNFSANDLDSLVFWVVPLGIIGSRLYHVLDKWSYYQDNLFQVLAVWNGGLGIYGGVAGGLVGILIFTKVKSIKYKVKSDEQENSKISLLNIIDFLMPSMAVGQIIGRWGNFFNHEVFGGPTNLPWKWYIPQNLRPEYWQQFSFFHPTFLYESLWCLIGFLILLVLEKYLFIFLELIMSLRGGTRLWRVTTWQSLAYARNSNKLRDSSRANLGRNDNKRIGLLTGFYAIWYGLGRFFLEFLRFDTAEIYGLKIAQIISLLLIILGVFLVKRAIEDKV